MQQNGKEKNRSKRHRRVSLQPRQIANDFCSSAASSLILPHHQLLLNQLLVILTTDTGLRQFSREFSWFLSFYVCAVCSNFVSMCEYYNQLIDATVIIGLLLVHWIKCLHILLSLHFVCCISSGVTDTRISLSCWFIMYRPRYILSCISAV